MNQILFLLLILIHAAFHLIRFVKEYEIGIPIKTNQSKFKPAAILWLTNAALLLLAGILYILNIDFWFIYAIVSILISQVLIIIYWHEMKWGTLANITIALILIFTLGTINFENNFREDIKFNLKKINLDENEILTEEDLMNLPEPVKKYIRYSGAINKPKVKYFKASFEGKMRSRNEAFFPFKAEQYNFLDEPARLFFMEGKMYGMTIPGYHSYSQKKAKMDIRFFGLIPIIQKSGAVMDKTETVTFFNDMCILAPAALIDERISWQSINDTIVHAVFQNGHISIQAELYFNRLGQLVNFISNDRTEINLMKKLPFSTPLSNYSEINGHFIMTYGEAVWQYPDEEFIYGKFNLTGLEYNTAPD